MPRKRSTRGVSSAILQVQRQAQSLLQALHREIQVKEAELSRLKEDESRLGGLAGRKIAVARPARARAMTRKAAGGRINWRKVLAQLPKQFKASHIRDVRGLKSKRPSEIFAAITRWIEAGLVKRKERGVYTRVG